MPRALITGGSAGLGRALAAGLVGRGWDVIVTGRDKARLDEVVRALGPHATGLAGDITDEWHRGALAELAVDGLDLLVNNASTLARSPLVAVQDLTDEDLRLVWEVNVVAPVDLVRRLRPSLRDGAAVIDVSSDAAIEHYETWGAYAASKAALDHLTLTLAGEDPDVRWWAVDPGDMRTQLHQDAFPGEDIGDRPLPESVVPAFLTLISMRPPSGRYRAAEFAPATVSV